MEFQDIVQETLLRLLERLRRVEQEQASAVVSLERLAYVVAFNYIRDLRRKDRRLVHAFTEDFIEQEAYSSLEEATENVYTETLFELLAQTIMQLPQKQREAILSDLAARMSFEAVPTPLQAAFLRQEIDLEAYQQNLPSTPAERVRHTALLYHAYKHLQRNLPIASYLEA
jgi:RNA polymerase sigma factor (sigma-70 family)